MGSRHFQTHILYYHYLGMTFRSKSILLDGFRSKHIIIKVLDYVFGDFKEPIGRKTYSLLCNEIVSSVNGRHYWYSSVSLLLLRSSVSTEDIIILRFLFLLSLRSSVSCERPSYYSTDFSLLIRYSVPCDRPYYYCSRYPSTFILRSSASNGRPCCYSIVNMDLFKYGLSIKLGI